MKTCKKIACILIICIISMTLKVYADASAQITLRASSTSVKVGETVKITVAGKSEAGLEGVDSILEYDQTKLKLESLQAQNYFASHSGTDDETGEFRFSMLYGDVGAPEEAPKEADVATLTFKVLEEATVNEQLSIKLSEIQIVDPDINTTEVQDQEIKLTVAENKNEGSGDENEGTGNENEGTGNEGEGSGNENEGTGNEGEDSGNENEGTGNEGEGSENEDEGAGNEGEGSGNGNEGTGNEGEGSENGTGNGNQESEGGNKEPDANTSKDPLPNAGAGVNGLILVVAAIVVTAILYKKNRSFKDVK